MMAQAGRGLLLVPHERAKAGFRRCQKAAEKDVAAAATLVAELQRRLVDQEDDEVNWDKVAQNLDKVEARLLGLKRRLGQANEQTHQLFDQMHERFTALQPGGALDDETRYFDMLMADHLVRTGRVHLGRALAERRGVAGLVDHQVFDRVAAVSRKICDEHSVKEALEWCADYESSLKKTNSSIVFQLHRMSFLDQVRNGRQLKAIAYAKKNLAQFAGNHMEELQATVAALLTADPKSAVVSSAAEQASNSKRRRIATPASQHTSIDLETGDATAADHSDHHGGGGDGAVERCPRGNPATKASVAATDAGWRELSRVFLGECTRVLQLDSQTSFSVLVKAGLAALRTPDCDPNFSARIAHQLAHPRSPSPSQAMLTATAAPSRAVRTLVDSADELADVENQLRACLFNFHAATRRSLNCPCCNSILGRIATRLPLAKLASSALICRLSGDIMNEDNPPMMLPDGQVFSLQALQKLCKEGTIQNPLVLPQGQPIPFDRLKRVFPA